MCPNPRRELAASLFFYVVITAVIGRDVLADLPGRIASDAGDPLLTAAILHWNATHLPWSEAWWQFPIYFPTRDALAFSEHLLGLTVVSAPFQWITGSALAAYNLTTLLTFPLCAAAMYALAFRLTRSASGAFVAGLAFGFAPYRMSQLSHVQMLALFWAPVSLLGLHAFVESGRRRWLALFGAGWMLQAAANGYMLFFFSLLAGLWVVWFVVVPRRWRDVRDVTLTALLASLPLAPCLYRYLTVHARHDFVRHIDEVRHFSADVAAVLCAPPALTFWGWMRVQCRPEGELFPGIAATTLFVVGLSRVLRAAPGEARQRACVAWARRALVLVAVAYGAVACSVMLVGPWQLDLGPLRASATFVAKPVFIVIASLLAALALSPGIPAAIRGSSPLAFYALAAIVLWLLALGPTPVVMGRSAGYSGPFAWLMLLPGVDGLRVPARFWSMSVLCLSVVAGFVVSQMFERRRGVGRRVGLALVTCAVLADGWPGRITAAPAPRPPADDAYALKGRTVLQLPIGDFEDMAAGFRAVTGGWRSVNGFSGYRPIYYAALMAAAKGADDGAVSPFRAYGDLDVVVAGDAPGLREMVERQPDVRVIARSGDATYYRLPRRGSTHEAPPGGRVGVRALRSRCAVRELRFAADGDARTRWLCAPQVTPVELIVELDTDATAGAVVFGLTGYADDFPRALVVETSMDGVAWEAARAGSVLGDVIAAGLRHPTTPRVVLPFAPRRARYVRLTHHADVPVHWSIAELEVWSGR